MARSASDIVDHSDRRKGEKLLFSGIGIAGGLTLTFFMIRGRSRARAAYSRALDHYTRVTAGYGSTRAKAGLIPSGEAHGAQVLARFAWFEDHYAGLIRAFQKFGEPRGAAWFFRERRLPPVQRIRRIHMGAMLLPASRCDHSRPQAARRASSGVRRRPTASRTSVGHNRLVSTPAAAGATKAVVAVPRTAPPAAPAIVTAVAAWAWVMPSGSTGSVTMRFMVSRWVRPMPMLATP